MSFLPLTQVQFRLAGWWPRNLTIAAIYIGVVMALTVMLYSGVPRAEHSGLDAGFLALVSAAQAVFVLLIAPSALRKAVQRDFQSGMIESHRLTPMSGLSLTLGYLTGPTAQAAVLFVAGLLIGSYFAGSYGQSQANTAWISLGLWHYAQLCLLFVALLVCSLTLLVAAATSGKTNILGFLIVLGIFGGWGAVYVAPGLALLMGVMSAGVLMDFFGQSGPVDGPGVTAWAVVLQVAVSVILLAATRTRLRYPERPLFSLPLGLLLMGVVGITLIVGYRHFATLDWLVDQVQANVVQWLGSTTAFLLVALFPIATAATLRYRADRTRVLGGQSPGVLHRLDALPLALLLMSAVVMFAMMPRGSLDAVGIQLPGQPAATAASPGSMPHVAALVLALMTSLWIDYVMICGMLLLRGKGVFTAAALSWGVLKALPLVLAGASQLLADVADADPGPVPEFFVTFSPIGTLAMARTDGPLWPGLIGQLGLAVGLTIIMFAVRRGLPRRFERYVRPTTDQLPST